MRKQGKQCGGVHDSFEILGEITAIETIAIGRRVLCARPLVRLYGRGRWRKMKGMATVRLLNGIVRVAEVHWYEAHGIGRVEFKRKRYVR